MPTENPDEKRNQLPSKRFVAMLYIPMLVPAAVPLFIARDQDDPLIIALMVGTTVLLLIANALLLVLLYRWFANMSES